MAKNDDGFEMRDVAWNGDLTIWPDFIRRVRLLWDATKKRNKKKLGPKVVQRLTDKAWDATNEIDHTKLKQSDGLLYLVKFLEERVCKTAIPDAGSRLEELLIKLRRRPGEQMGPWASRVREAYRQVQKALRRARVQKGGPPPGFPSGPSPAGFGLMPGKEESKPPEARKEREEKEKDDSESEDDEDIWAQFQAEGSEHEVLPPEILGWLLLRRAGLTPQQRLSVQSATNNSLIFDEIEVALRDQEEDLLAQDKFQKRGFSGPPKRTYWAEEDGFWVQFDMEEEPSHIDWESAVFWNVPEEEENESSWWSEPGGEDWDAFVWMAAQWGVDVTEQSTPEEDASEKQAEQELNEAYAAYQSKVKTFAQSKASQKATHLSRGFYPRKGKQKGMGKGGDLAAFAFRKGGKGGPMKSAYSGCFICGSKDHTYANCPARGQGKGKSKGGQKTLYALSFMITGSSSSTGSVPELRDALLAQTTKFKNELEELIENIVQKKADVPESVSQRECTAWATLKDEARGMGVIDCGATETIGSLEAIQIVFDERVRLYGPQHVVVNTDVRTNFRFGNGASQCAESLVELEQTIDGQPARLMIHSLDAEGVPILISVKDLKALGAVIDFGASLCCLTKCSNKVFRLKEASSGHLLLDLCRDLLLEGESVDSIPPAMASMVAAAAERHLGLPE